MKQIYILFLILFATIIIAQPTMPPTQLIGEFDQDIPDGANVVFKVAGEEIANSQVIDGGFGNTNNNIVFIPTGNENNVEIFIEDIKVAEIADVSSSTILDINIPSEINTEIQEKINRNTLDKIQDSISSPSINTASLSSSSRGSSGGSSHSVNSYHQNRFIKIANNTNIDTRTEPQVDIITKVTPDLTDNNNEDLEVTNDNENIAVKSKEANKESPLLTKKTNYKSDTTTMIKTREKNYNYFMFIIMGGFSVFLLLGTFVYEREKKMIKVKALKEHELAKHALNELLKSIKEEEIRHDLSLTEHDSTVIEDAINEAKTKFYIMSARQNGYSNLDIRSKLLNKGWPKENIDKLMSSPENKEAIV